MRFSIPRFLVASLFLLLGPALLADTLMVPGDYATLQEAIDNAQPGDTIRVLGGTHAPIVVDKELTIVGSPVATIDNSVSSTSSFQIDPAIRLQGPGSGRATLVNLRVDNFVSGIIYAQSAPAVDGGGFASLLICDCVLEAPEWKLLSGAGIGVPAIDVDVADVLISGSRVVGSATEWDTLFTGPNPPPSGAGLRAPLATVVLLDTAVVGGDGSTVGIADLAGPCPCGMLGGEGAPGVVAKRVLHAGSQVSGGQGGAVFADVLNQPTFVGNQMGGLSFEADEVVKLDDALTDSGSLDLGATWTLKWSTPSATVLLLVSTHVTPASSVPGKGLLFLDPADLIVVPVPSGGSGSLTITTPASAVDLIGTPIGVQVYDAVTGLTRPVLNALQIP